MKSSHRYSKLKFYVALGTGALISLLLCIQCVRTFAYTISVLIPQQAEREAERQAGELSAAARNAGITDPRTLGPVIQRVLDATSDRALWIRVLDLDSNVLAQAGTAQGPAVVPSQWWDRLEKHQDPGTLVDTSEGNTLVAMLPFRMPHPAFSPAGRPPADRHTAYVVQLAIPLKAVAGSFDKLRDNLVVGLVTAIALLASLVMIALRTPSYLRGKYLDSELQLAKRVQSDLAPKPQSVSPFLDFAASALAADHVGGDFYDVFETEPGKIGILLGDASGKGIPAALLISVLQGAIRSSNTFHHELACERINRMLCERTACERFATLFWGVFDTEAGTLRYVNAGHVAPLLLLNREMRIQPLIEGGPVLGLLPGHTIAPGRSPLGPPIHSFSTQTESPRRWGGTGRSSEKIDCGD